MQNHNLHIVIYNFGVLSWITAKLQNTVDILKLIKTILLVSELIQHNSKNNLSR